MVRRKAFIYLKNIKLKILPEISDDAAAVAVNDVASKMLDYQADHFAFIDQHIHTGGSFNIDSAMQSFYNTGINLGLVVDVDKIEKGKANETLAQHVVKYSHLPVFLGIFRNNLQLLEGVTPATTSQFDYVIGDITRFKNSRGMEADVLKNENIEDPTSENVTFLVFFTFFY